MKTKFTMMLIGALILGIVIGVLATGQYTRHKVVRIKEMGTPDGMQKRFYQLLDPTEAQLELIGPILDTFALQSQEMRKRHWTERASLFNEMQENLRPHLTTEQLESLEDLKLRPPQRGERKRERMHKNNADAYDQKRLNQKD